MDDNRDLLARLLMGHGHGAPPLSPLSGLMNETIVPRQPGNEDIVRSYLHGPSVLSGMVTRGTEDQSMSPANMAMGLLGGPGRRLPNVYGAISDLRNTLGVRGNNPAQQAYDASRAETNRVLGVVNDALGPGPRPAPTNPPPSTDDVIRAIQEALAIRNK